MEKGCKGPTCLKVLLLGCLIMISLLAGCRGCKKTTEPNGDQWDPRNVSRNEGLSYGASLALDNGNVHIVWADDTPGKYEILHSQKSLNGNWLEPVNISNTPTPSEVPKIGIDPSGNLHVVWEEHGVGIFYSMKPNGGDWSEPIEISSSGELPELEVDDACDVHVIWMDGYYRKKSGGVWGSIEPIPSPAGYCCNPAMAVSPGGDVHVVFEPSGYDPSEVYHIMKPAGGSWTEPVNVSESLLYSWVPDIAMDSENVYIAWKEVKIGVDQIFFRIRASDGSWTEIDSVPNIIGEATGPWVAIAARDGCLHFLWEAKVGDNIDMYYKARNENGSWSEGVNVSNTGGAGPAVVVLDVLENLHVAWSDESPGNWEIFYVTVAKN